MNHAAFPMRIYGGIFKKEKRLIQASSNPLGGKTGLKIGQKNRKKE